MEQAITGFSGPVGRVERLHVARGTEFEIEADLVLLAIGFAGPVRDQLLEDLDLGYTDRGAIRSENGFGTKKPSVFVVGDAKLGASLIVWAIVEGQQGRLPGRYPPDGRESASALTSPPLRASAQALPKEREVPC